MNRRLIHIVFVIVIDIDIFTVIIVITVVYCSYVDKQLTTPLYYSPTQHITGMKPKLNALTKKQTCTVLHTPTTTAPSQSISVSFRSSLRTDRISSGAQFASSTLTMPAHTTPRGDMRRSFTTTLSVSITSLRYVHTYHLTHMRGQ